MIVAWKLMGLSRSERTDFRFLAPRFHHPLGRRRSFFCAMRRVISLVVLRFILDSAVEVEALPALQFPVRPKQFLLDIAKELYDAGKTPFGL